MKKLRVRLGERSCAGQIFPKRRGIRVRRYAGVDGRFLTVDLGYLGKRPSLSRLLYRLGVEFQVGGWESILCAHGSLSSRGYWPSAGL